MKRKRHWFAPIANIYARTAYVSIAYSSNKKDSAWITVKFGSGSRSVRFNLTKLTVEELDFLQEILNEIIDTIRPTCARLDEEAKKESEENDRPNPRTYRTLPEVHRRPESIESDDHLLPEGA